MDSNPHFSHTDSSGGTPYICCQPGGSWAEAVQKPPTDPSGRPKSPAAKLTLNAVRE